MTARVLEALGIDTTVNIYKETQLIVADGGRIKHVSNLYNSYLNVMNSFINVRVPVYPC